MMEEKMEEEQKEEFAKDETVEEKDWCVSKICKKKIKNYNSIIILLAGLLVGSVFVDVAQFVSRTGFSPRALKDASVVPFEGKTWVAYSEPVVDLQVITDSQCQECDATEPLKMMKRVIPTLVPKKIAFDSVEGKALVDKMKIKSLPAFVFGSDITKTDIYTQAQELFQKEGDNYLLSAEQIGVRPGKFLALPEVKEDDNQIGQKDAKVKVVLFSDFQCPYCKTFYEQAYKKAITDYKDRVLFVFKHLPLQIHDKAEAAAEASDCPGEQGKCWEMADRLYARQADWGKANSPAVFKTYAAGLGLNAVKFNECVDQKKFKDKISA